MSLWRLSCDACGFEARAGTGPDGVSGWCEACQRSAPLGSATGAPRSPLCPTCGAALSIGSFRFEELYGELQNLAAVLSAWAGDPGPLAALLPDRPRFLTDLDPPERRPAVKIACVRTRRRNANGEWPRSAEVSPRSSFKISSRPRGSAINMVAAVPDPIALCNFRRSLTGISARERNSSILPRVAISMVEVRKVWVSTWAGLFQARAAN